MNYSDIRIRQIVSIEKEGNQYEGFYGKVAYKGNPEEDGRYFIRVTFFLKEVGDEAVSIDVNFDHEALADDDGLWDPYEFQHQCPTVIDQFNDAEERFEEQCGGLPLEEEIRSVFETGDFCRALRYLLDTEKMVHGMSKRISYDNDLITRKLRGGS